MLRASSEVHGEEIDLRGALVDETDSGVPHAAVLLAFADAVVSRDAGAMTAARNGLIQEMGEAAMVDAAGVASNFERMVRIADATGIPLNEQIEASTADIRSELGLEAMRRA